MTPIKDDIKKIILDSKSYKNIDDIFQSGDEANDIKIEKITLDGEFEYDKEKEEI